MLINCGFSYIFCFLDIFADKPKIVKVKFEIYKPLGCFIIINNLTWYV